MANSESLSTCRLCGLSCKQSIDIFGRLDCLNSLQYKIKQLLDIAVGRKDNLPHSVCLLCVSKLDSLWCFKNTCHQVQIKLRKMNGSMMIADRLHSDFDKKPSNVVTLGLRTHKNDSYTIHDENELYQLKSSTSKSSSSTDLLGDNFKEYSDDINLRKKKSISPHIDSAPVSLAVELENNKTNQLNEGNVFSDLCLDFGSKSASDNIESTLIHSQNVDNCISNYEDTNDYNCNVDDNSMSIGSEGNDNVECDTDISSYDLQKTSSSLMNTSTSLCEVVNNSGVNSSSIANRTEDNINVCCNSSFRTKEQNDGYSTEISLLSATTSSEIAKSFEGHYYRMEADMYSDLLCNRVPYLVVESRMGIKHMIYTVSPNLSQFDIEHNYKLNTDSVYLTVEMFDLENPKTVSILIEWLNNILKGEISLMPYYISWLDEKNKLNLGFKCIICKIIIRNSHNRHRQLVMNHIAEHLLFICPVCDRFHRNISRMKKHLYQHEPVTFECSTCSKKFSDFQKYIMHKRGHYKFKCLSCRFECFVENKWLKHLEEHRKKICSSDCCLFYESLDKFQKHVSVLSTVGGYVCGACGMTYHCEEYLKLHLKVHGLEHGSKTRPTSEDSLPESTGSQNKVSNKIIDRLKNANENLHFDTLKNILDNEIDLKEFQTSSTALGGRVFTGFMCFKCSRIVKSEKKFRIHIRNHFMMTCYCKKYSANGIAALRNHFKLCEFKRRICVHCRNDVWLDTSTEYLEHLSFHQKRRMCIYCQQVMPTPLKLERHITSSHNTEETKHWFCKDCNETLVVSYKSLEACKFNHFKETHPEKLESFVCEICGETFNSKAGLYKHTMRKHSAKDNILICAYCSKEFSMKRSLIIHIQRHMNEKTFKCAICDKGFNRESSLNKHKLDMHSVKKHMCNECGKRFSYPSALRDHLKKAHYLVKSAISKGTGNH